MNTLIKRQTATVTASQLPIIFDFSELRPISYIDAKKDNSGASRFMLGMLERFQTISQTTWAAAITAHHHTKVGIEKLKKSSMTRSAQERLPDDVSELIAFRSTGDNQVMAGIRIGNVFKVFFIEYRHGDISLHNKTGHKHS